MLQLPPGDIAAGNLRRLRPYEDAADVTVAASNRDQSRPGGVFGARVEGDGGKERSPLSHHRHPEAATRPSADSRQHVIDAVASAKKRATDYPANRVEGMAGGQARPFRPLCEELDMKKILLATIAAAAACAAIAPAQARQGCGIGGHRDGWGHCRPNGGAFVAPGLRIGVFYPGNGYWDGRRYWWHREWRHGGWRYR